MANEYDDLLSSFIAESLEMLDQAESSVLSLEQEYDKGVVNDIFRAFHTIKGDSGIFGLQEITDLSHALENVLDQIRNENLAVTMERIDLLLTGVDRLRQLVNTIQKPETVVVDDIMRQLEEALSGDSKSGGAAAQDSAEKEGAKNIVEQAPHKSPQTVLKQSGREPGTGKISLRIPKEFRQLASQENRYLSLVYLDLYRQQAQSLLEMRQMIEGLEDRGYLLMQGVLEQKLPGLVQESDVLLPYYFLLKTDEPVESFLKRYQISGKILKKIYEPPADSRPQQATPVPEEVGNSADETVHDSSGQPVGGFFGERQQAEEKVDTVDTAEAGSGQAELVSEREAPAQQEQPVAQSGQAGASVAASEPAREQEAPSSEQLSAEVAVSASLEAAPEEASGGEAASVPEEAEKAPDKATPGNVKKSMEAFRDKGDTHLKVHIELLDELINLAGETIIARNDLTQKVERFKDPGLSVTAKKVSYLITKLQESIMRTRLQEINSIFQRLPRLVRDLCQITGKKVNLVTEGGDVELDKTLIDAIVDPVMHMVRNSIDHGIERQEERKAAGKIVEGTLRMVASLRGGNVVLQIIDDGKGMDPEKLKEKAMEKGIITEREARDMEDEDAYELIFEPGFSTAANITQTSGRGVGMDVVRTNFKRVGGTVDIMSEKGQGTTMTATLPQTLSIITCLMVEIGSKLYALPQQNIESLILIEEENMTEVEGHQMYKLRGHLLPLIRISEVLYPDREAYDEPRYVAVVRSDRHRFGVLLDEINNPEEIVVKPLGEHFSDLSIFSGAAIMGDGEAVLILDIPGIARFSNLQSNLREELAQEAREKELETSEQDTGYLVIGVANNHFAMPISAVPRIEKISEDTIESFMDLETIVFNGEIIPLVRLERMFKLKDKAHGDKLHVLIFDINDMRVGVLADEIFNVVESLPGLETSAYLGESVLGQAIINERKTVVLDIRDLLERLQRTRFRELRQYLSGEAVSTEQETPVAAGGENGS